MSNKDLNDFIKELALKNKELGLELNFTNEEWLEFIKLMGFEEKEE